MEMKKSKSVDRQVRLRLSTREVPHSPPPITRKQQLVLGVRLVSADFDHCPMGGP